MFRDTFDLVSFLTLHHQQFLVKIMDIFTWQTEMSEIFESHSKLDGGFFFHHAIWLKIWKHIDSVPLRFSSVKNHTSSLHCLPLVLYPLNYSLLTFSFSQCWEPHTLTAHVSSGKNLLICEPESSCSALFTMNVVWLSREVGRADTVRWVKPPGWCAKCIRAVWSLELSTNKIIRPSSSVCANWK